MTKVICNFCSVELKENPRRCCSDGHSMDAYGEIKDGLNNFSSRLTVAIKHLEKLKGLRKSLDDNSIPGTFVTGNSGISPSRRRRLDRQLDKTIDLAVAINKAKAEVLSLTRKSELRSMGRIHANGRKVTPKNPKRPYKFKSVTVAVKKMIQDMSIYGIHSFKDHCIKYLVGYPEWIAYTGQPPYGIIQVVLPNDAIVQFRSESIQGADLERTAITVFMGIFNDTLEQMKEQGDK